MIICLYIQVFFTVCDECGEELCYGDCKKFQYDDCKVSRLENCSKIILPA